MPNWIRSIPKEFTRFSIRGTIITMMQLPSIRQPRIRKITLIISKTTNLEDTREVIAFINS